MNGVKLVEKLVASKTLELIRKTSGRDVFRAQLNGECYYVKSFRSRGMLDRIRKLFTGSKAYLEFETLQRLKQLGIGAPEPLAYLESRTHSVLVTRAIKDTLNLKSVLASRGFYLDEKIRLLQNLASFVRKMHDAGYLHPDPHAGNILVRLPDYEFFIVDPQRSTFKKIGLHEREKQVAFIIFSIYRFFNRADILRFLKFYGITDFKAIMPKLEALSYRYLRSRGKRCVVDSSEFARQKSKGRLIYIRRDADRESLLHSMKNAHAVKTLPNRELLVSGNAFMKRFTPLHDKALAIWKNSHGLKLRGVKTFKTFMYIRDKKGTMVFGEWLQGAVPLSNYVRDSYRLLSFEEKKRFIINAARFIKYMHDMGVFHADLKANNIMVKGEDFYIIDIEDVQFKRKLSQEDKIKNLVQLNAAVSKQVSKSDRLRFFHYYADREMLLTRDSIISRIMKDTIDRHHVWP